MSKPAFIVDGFTEVRIVQRLCPGSPVHRTDLNGKSVTIEAIANKISFHIRSFGNKYYPIIVLVDKEERNIPCQEMISRLKELLDVNFADQDIRVGVADRMIENWIIADWDKIANPNFPRPKKTDGINGTSVIKKLLGSYDKRADGVELFTRCSPSKLYVNSPSFKYFVEILKGIDCNFINFEK